MGPVGFSSQMFWGLTSLVQLLKAGVPEVGYRCFHSSGSSGSVGSLPMVGCPTRDVAYAETISASPTHLDVALFSVVGVKELLT